MGKDKSGAMPVAPLVGAVEELKAKVVAERSVRVAACEKEVVAVLKKHRCALDATMLVKQGNVQAEIRVVAAE